MGFKDQLSYCLGAPHCKRTLLNTQIELETAQARYWPYILFVILRLLNSKRPVWAQYPIYIYIHIYIIYIYRSYIYTSYIYTYMLYTHMISYRYIYMIICIHIYIYSILYIVVRPTPHPRAARKHQDVCRPADMCDSQPKTCGFHQKTNPIYILHSQTYDICICNCILWYMYIYICICVCIYIYMYVYVYIYMY
jgi:hypothetical protein